MPTPTYAEIEEMSDPNEIATAAANVAAGVADGSIDSYEGEITLALLDAKSENVYAQNAAEVSAYEDYANADASDVAVAMPTASGSWLGRVYDALFKDDDE